MAFEEFGGGEFFFGGEGFGEVGEGVVADFEGDFGDVVLAGGEEFGGAFDAEGAEVEGEGFAGFLFDEAGEVVGSAADVLGEVGEVE